MRYSLLKISGSRSQLFARRVNNGFNHGIWCKPYFKNISGVKEVTNPSSYVVMYAKLDWRLNCFSKEHKFLYQWLAGSYTECFCEVEENP